MSADEFRSKLDSAPDHGQAIPTESLIGELHRLANELGDVPTTREMNDIGEYSTKPYRDRFGSWTDALDIAGFDHDKRTTNPPKDSLHRDRDWLVEKYHDEGKSQSEVADLVGVTRETIRYWLNKYEIESHGFSDWRRKERASYGLNRHGYAQWRSWNPSEKVDEKVRVHRLLAVAEYGFDSVCGSEIHHKNGLKWDNRPGNITLIETSEHRSIHMKERWEDSEWREKMTKLAENRQRNDQGDFV